MVGMPYANLHDAVLAEKMTYLNVTQHNSAAGAEFYENMCMKTVNQCIGML